MCSAWCAKRAQVVTRQAFLWLILIGCYQEDDTLEILLLPRQLRAGDPHHAG